METNNLKQSFSKIKLIVTDFDGVWTDNSVLHFEDGREAVVRSKLDSLGIDVLEYAGVYDKQNYENEDHQVDIIILSKETNPIVKSVGEKIKVKQKGSIDKKENTFKEEIKKRNLDSSEVVFIGNDINDIECIKIAGIGVCVNDAVQEVKEISDYITEKKGGQGAVREIIDIILNSL